MKFNKDRKTIFLDTYTNIVLGDEKLDVILSPSLYWVKKVKLPVKYVRDAKKLLVSLFEDVLPEGDYSYSTYKEDDEFYIFAYEDKVVLDLLTTQGISPNNISSIHFAQSELDKIEGAIKINEKQSIYVKDSIVTLVPCCWIEENGSLNLKDMKLSKHTISLQHFGHIVDSSSLKKIAAVAIAFIVLILSELFIVKSNINKVQTQTQELASKYELKPTMFQNKAVLKKYKSIHATQTNFRQEMSKALKQKNITTITYKNKILKVGS
ncbi:MAG: hypothetical protein L3I99_05145 [Sulfurimonas sp.]|nr:hypothetical protein [Sulfurimonas sp.]